MADKQRMPMRSDTPEYHQGYLDGRRSAFDDAELDAYYAGVGYGKKLHKTEHMGFRNEKERQEFESGIADSKKYFHSYRAEPPRLFERLFLRRSLKKEIPTGAYQRKQDLRITKRQGKTSRKKLKKKYKEYRKG